jgi:PmbA protein
MEHPFNIGNLEGMANDVIREAKKAGADEADAIIQIGRESEVSSRMGKIETLKEAVSQGLGIRVFKDRKLGFCHTSDLSLETIRRIVTQAVELAEYTSTDQFNGLPESSNGRRYPDLDLYDDGIRKIVAGEKIAFCMEMEQAMFEYDKRIKNSEGVGVFDGDGVTIIADSNGRSHSYKSSYCYLVCNPIAAEGDKLQSGSWHSAKRFFKDLDPPQKVARTAAERAIQMLGARPARTANVPVVFDILTASSLISSILGALDGDAVYKGASFLAGKLDQQVASELVTLIDDGTIVRGLGSSPIDGEGLFTRKKEVIAQGRLQKFLYDSYTARRAGAQPTANARREYQSLPSIGPFNFYLQAGNSSFEEIIKSVKSGLYVTNLMGFGANTVTGDYSLGASGLWIEDGQFAYPVEGVTVAANMLDIMQRVDMVGNDLNFMGPVASPTFRVSEMTVSGA